MEENYSISLDTSELEASAKKVRDTFKTMGNDIEKEGKRIDNAFDSLGGKSLVGISMACGYLYEKPWG